MKSCCCGNGVSVYVEGCMWQLCVQRTTACAPSGLLAVTLPYCRGQCCVDTAAVCPKDNIPCSGCSLVSKAPPLQGAVQHRAVFFEQHQLLSAGLSLQGLLEGAAGSSQAVCHLSFPKLGEAFTETGTPRHSETPAASSGSGIRF